MSFFLDFSFMYIVTSVLKMNSSYFPLSHSRSLKLPNFKFTSCSNKFNAVFKFCIYF